MTSAQSASHEKQLIKRKAVSQSSTWCCQSG